MIFFPWIEEVVYGVVGFALARKAVKQTRSDRTHSHNHAILLLAHGTPDTLGEMDEYLRRVTGGRGVPPHVVEELQHRYAEIGLRDTPTAEGPHLTRWTMQQARLLQATLRHRVYVGMRNWKPFVADTVTTMKRDGITSVTAICLAPQNSRTSTGLYKKALTDATGYDISIEFIAGWGTQPKLIAAFAQRLRAALKAARSSDKQAKVATLFTAHAVPCRTIQASAKPVEHHGMVLATEPDTYAIECKQTADLVAYALRGTLKPQDTFFAFQSQGISGGPWIGPTVEDTLPALKQAGYTHVVVQPIGFVCDHVEVLYDIDIAFTRLAEELGLKLSRAESLNDSPLLTEALAELISNGARAAVPMQAPKIQAEVRSTALPDPEVQ